MTKLYTQFKSSSLIICAFSFGIIASACADGVSQIDVCESMQLVNCNGICIDPQSSPQYCGADSSCLKFISCHEDEFCQSGQCQKITVSEDSPDEHSDGHQDTCDGFTKYCRNNSIIGCVDGNITVEEFCSGVKPVCDPHTVTCTALPDAICTEGEFKCESNTPSICVGNTWYPKAHCSRGTYCNSLTGECTASGEVEINPEETCTDGMVRCENNVPMTCKNSKWSLKDKCDDNSYCNSITANCDRIETIDCSVTPNDTSCIAQPEVRIICNDNEQRCIYGTLQNCQDNEWVNTQACESGQCSDETTCADLICHTGETQCSEEAVVQVCAENQWLDIMQCTPGQCENGKCMDIVNNSNAVLCNGELIDPSTSSDYCGADANCEGYSICNQNQVCYNSKCQSKCFEFPHSQDDTARLKEKYDLNKDGCLQPDETQLIFTITVRKNNIYQQTYADDLLLLPNLVYMPTSPYFHDNGNIIEVNSLYSFSGQTMDSGEICLDTTTSVNFHGSKSNTYKFKFPNVKDSRCALISIESINATEGIRYQMGPIYLDLPNVNTIYKINLIPSEINQGTLKLTTQKNITIKNTSWLNPPKSAKFTSLYLNVNKSPGGTGYPRATTDNVWAGYTWKEIIYVE